MKTDFIHKFLPGKDPRGPTVLLLHGTGGDENDLIPIGRALAPGAAILSPRGKILEHGMPRFFRRLSEGVFDLEDLALRVTELAAFVREASEEYAFDARRVWAIGYSNGANIAAAELLLEPGLLAGGVFFRPMLPGIANILPNGDLPKLPGTPALLMAGERDDIVKPEHTKRLASILSQAGAKVEVQWRDSGHELTPEDFQAAQAWLKPLLTTAAQ